MDKSTMDELKEFYGVSLLVVFIALIKENLHGENADNFFDTHKIYCRFMREGLRDLVAGLLRIHELDYAPDELLKLLPEEIAINFFRGTLK